MEIKVDIEAKEEEVKQEPLSVPLKKSKKKRNKNGHKIHKRGDSMKDRARLSLTKIERYIVKGQTKVNKADGITKEKSEITQARMRLKYLKKDIKSITKVANDLLKARKETSKCLNTFCSAVKNIKTVNVKIDKTNYYGKFLRMIAGSLGPLDQLYDIHLDKMTNEFIKPFQEFGRDDINNCEKTKWALKTKKGNYDMAILNERRVIKFIKKANNTTKKARNKSKKCFQELQKARKNFLNAVDILESNKIVLLGHLQKYYTNYAIFSKMQATTLIGLQNDIPKIYHHDINNDGIDVNDERNNYYYSTPGGPNDRQGYKKFMNFSKNNKQKLYLNDDSYDDFDDNKNEDIKIAEQDPNPDAYVGPIDPYYHYYYNIKNNHNNMAKELGIKNIEIKPKSYNAFHREIRSMSEFGYNFNDNNKNINSNNINGINSVRSVPWNNEEKEIIEQTGINDMDNIIDNDVYSGINDHHVLPLNENEYETSVSDQTTHDPLDDESNISVTHMASKYQKKLENRIKSDNAVDQIMYNDVAKYHQQNGYNNYSNQELKEMELMRMYQEQALLAYKIKKENGNANLDDPTLYLQHSEEIKIQNENNNNNNNNNNNDMNSKPINVINIEHSIDAKSDNAGSDDASSSSSFDWNQVRRQVRAISNVNPNQNNINYNNNNNSNKNKNVLKVESINHQMTIL